ncbi:MAG TPA: cyclase family protein [Streptosporangiaceae bacterium]|nr:cyclase family protein [Streptosporangiaceae bacterium]
MDKPEQKDIEDWSGAWRPPRYEVDGNDKIIGYVNDRTPNNWGRWGELDELGTINFLTPERVRTALALPRTGDVISCAIPISEIMPVHPSRPAVVHTHALTGTDIVSGLVADRANGGFFGSDDYLFFPLQSATHWDGLTHAYQDATMYNGFWVGAVGAAGGARRCSIHLLAGRLTGRGVLLDVARHQEVTRLLPGHAITADQLELCAEAEHVDLRAGDILLVRTGELRWFFDLEDKTPYWSGAHPGLSIDTVDWIHSREFAAIAIDNRTFEVTPFEHTGGVTYPLHARLICDLGLTIGELWWLEDLASACARAGRWEFLLSAPPLPVAGASGAPTTPIAYL